MNDQGRHCVYTTTSGRRPFRYGGRASYDPITHSVTEMSTNNLQEQPMITDKFSVTATYTSYARTESDYVPGSIRISLGGHEFEVAVEHALEFGQQILKSAEMVQKSSEMALGK